MTFSSINIYNSNCEYFGEPTSFSLAMSYRDVDGDPDRNAVGVFVFGCSYDTYGTGFLSGQGDRIERSGERSRRGRTRFYFVSESQTRAWSHFS